MVLGVCQQETQFRSLWQSRKRLLWTVTCSNYSQTTVTVTYQWTSISHLILGIKTASNQSQINKWSASYISYKWGTTRICCCMPCYDSVQLWCQQCSNRSISPTRWAHSSKHAEWCVCVWDRLTDRHCTMPIINLQNSIVILWHSSLVWTDISTWSPNKIKCKRRINKTVFTD